jgi:hypothetical protein
VLRQGIEMCTFRSVKTQRPTYPLQEIGGDLNSAALLEPSVPRDPDPGEMSNLFPPQPWCTATRPDRQSNVLGRNSCTPITYEIRQSSAVVSAL